MDDYRPPIKKTYTPIQARQLAEKYCAYQDRSQQEVRDKLYSYGLHHDEVENLIVELIDTGFLNESRFAAAYVLGKFNSKGWGKNKIKQGLFLKSVSKPIIAKSMTLLDPEDYFQKLQTILQKKSAQIQESDPYKRKQKLIMYAQSKGYEIDLIYEILNDNTL